MADTTQTPNTPQSPQGRGYGAGSRAPRGGRNQSQEPEEPKEFEEKMLNLDRVSRVVKGGRRFRFKALVVVGDKKGRVGVGVAKGADVQAAVAKATEVAKRNIIKITMYKGTIAHEAQFKVAGANILIKPASPGTGIIAGGVVRPILEAAGISDVLSKSLGSSNKVNSAYATIEALKSIVPAKFWLTRNEKIAPTKEAK
jgi:small subunit ribosomal protein S5